MNVFRPSRLAALCIVAVATWACGSDDKRPTMDPTIAAGAQASAAGTGAASGAPGTRGSGVGLGSAGRAGMPAGGAGSPAAGAGSSARAGSTHCTRPPMKKTLRSCDGIWIVVRGVQNQRHRGDDWAPKALLLALSKLASPRNFFDAATI